MNFIEYTFVVPPWFTPGLLQNDEEKAPPFGGAFDLTDG
jgi:hypothetical protein